MTKTRVALFLCTILMGSNLLASEFDWATNFNDGDKFPISQLTSTDSQTVSTDQLSGNNGFLIQFNRSVVW